MEEKRNLDINKCLLIKRKDCCIDISENDIVITYKDEVPIDLRLRVLTRNTILRIANSVNRSSQVDEGLVKLLEVLLANKKD